MDAARFDKTRRIIELTDDGCIDRVCSYDEYMHMMGRDVNEIRE